MLKIKCHWDNIYSKGKKKYLWFSEKLISCKKKNPLELLSSYKLSNLRDNIYHNPFLWDGLKTKVVLCSQSNGLCYMAYSIWIFRKSNPTWVQKMGPSIIIWHSVSVKMLLFPNFCIGSVLLILIFYVIYWIALWSVFVSLWLIHWFWLIGFLNLFIVYTDKLSVVEEIKDEYVTILAKFYIYIYIHSLRTTLLVCSLL